MLLPYLTAFGQHAATVLTCMQVTAINAAKLCVLQQNNRLRTQKTHEGQLENTESGNNRNGNGRNQLTLQ